MIRGNFHTHSTYCDGKSTLEETVLAAIESGMDAVGFSGHAHTTHDSRYCMTVEGTESYRRDIMALKEKYKDKIEIYLGTECDLYSKIDRSAYDYIIGSVHYTKATDGTLCEVDHSEDMFISYVNNHFDGDYLKFAKSYYESVAQIGKLKPDIVGHVDLIVKYNEGNKYFDQNDKKYLDMAFEAIDAIMPDCDLFEMNTGAISRGYNTIYPALPLLKRLHKKNARITLTSDCHDADYLDCNYKESIEILKNAGFKSAYCLLEGKFVEQPL